MGLNLKNGDIVVDATLGGGGHASAILDEIGKDGKLIGIDLDSRAIKGFKNKSTGSAILVHDNFANLECILSDLGIEKVDAILADLGFSSDQMEDVDRGFSFQKDAELDMRLDQAAGLTAKDIVNNYDEKDLERIIRDYGEEKFYKNIAKKICQARRIKEVRTTKELAEIIISAIPGKYQLRGKQKIHPATRTFQAIRIETNKELENLEKFLRISIDALKPGGRLAVISFHSLEDRIVKNMFRENARGCICPPVLPVCRCKHKPALKILTKKPIVPSEREISDNPRSRSAKLRIAEKTA